MADDAAAQLNEQEVPDESSQNESPDIAAELEKEKAARVKAEEIAKNQEIRAKKAEQALKEKEPESSSSENLSPQEIIALGKLHEDDVETVLDWARFKKLKVNEASKDEDLKVILQRREEMRRTAQATQTRGGQRSGQTPDNDVILRKASQGELPESDADIEKLTAARMESKLKK